MEKPITVIKKEFEDKLAQEINQCGLPPFILRPIFQDVLNQLINLENQQLQNDMAQYEASKELESEVCNE